MKYHIIVEGPSGAGKTTLCKRLLVMLQANNQQVYLIPEFSSTDLGIELSKMSNFSPESDKVKSTTSRTLLYLADKLSMYEKAASSSKKYDVIISDRSFITQNIMGVYGNDLKLDAITSKISNDLGLWLNENLTCKTIYVFLSCDTGKLINRLEKRLDRTLTSDEIKLLDYQVARYKVYRESLFYDGPVIFKDSNKPIHSVINDILACM